MKNRLFLFGIGMVAISALSASQGFSQAQTAQNRIPQQIVINGQMVNGAHVTTAGGQLQSFTCSTPQHYTTADGGSQGWACYEQTTGVWLLNAMPPAQPQVAPGPPAVSQPQVQQQPPVIYQQAPPTVVYQQAPPAVVYQQPAVVYQQPAVVYQQSAVVYQQPAVVYQQAPPAVIYQQAPPTVIYQQPVSTVVYTAPQRPVVIAPAYPSSVVLGAAAINAAGRIASAAIINSRHSRDYYYSYEPARGRRR